MKKGLTCCLTGNRQQSVPFGFNEQDQRCIQLSNKIVDLIDTMITENKVTHYISGMALGIDQICAELVLEIKSRYPKITLECAIPCEEQAIRWTEPQRDRYFSILERCDKETIIICGIQSSLIIMVFLFQSTVNKVRIFLRL